MQVSSSINLHQTSSSTISQLSTLSSMSVSYSPNKKEEDISESSSLSNMQSSNSISESGIASFSSITNEIADKVNLNSNDEKVSNIDASSSSDTEYSSNSIANDFDIKKEPPVTFKVSDKKSKNSINVLSRFNPSKNKKKNQNQNQNKIKSKVSIFFYMMKNIYIHVFISISLFIEFLKMLLILNVLYND